MSRPAPPEPEPASQPAGATTRPASLWPDATRPGGGAETSTLISRFDPLADERVALQARSAASFDVCHPALALRAVLLVQAVLALAALAGASDLADWGQRQAVLAFGGVAATLLWLVAVCALRPLLAVAPPARRTAVVLGLGAMAALAGWAPLAWAGLAGAGASGLRAVGLSLTGLAFAALLWAWLDLRARIWHPANASARLAELQSRIRPHFLFNALNTALALVRVDPGRAEAVLEDLAELFRVALAETGVSVTLQEEIELARRYLAIEEVRFGARLAVHWDIDPRVHGARLPPLVLQPLVENAVRHGIEPAARGGRVLVQANVQRGQVVVVVSNTLGPEPGHPGHGMALHNVRERLRLLHDVAAQCDVWRDVAPQRDGQVEMFHARITLPMP
jgi:two-component system sensor histidine kinase AlgZ